MLPLGMIGSEQIPPPALEQHSARGVSGVGWDSSSGGLKRGWNLEGLRQ